MFQTPAPRGGVPLQPSANADHVPTQQVSNPCASGRCSSGTTTVVQVDQFLSFKPLRLGAVFLWVIWLAWQMEANQSFKPLRLGAVFL